MRARAGKGRDGRRAVGAAVALGLVALLAAPPARAADKGLRIEIAGHRLRAVDLATGQAGPELSVATGSPAQPTPQGRFPIYRVILRPRWSPGRDALANGAQPVPSSTTSPMGVAKIPFADGGAVALHGGGDRHLLGKPVSSGCVRAADADLLRLLAWLDLRGALGPPVERDGEVHRAVERPTRLVVRSGP